MSNSHKLPRRDFLKLSAAAAAGLVTAAGGVEVSASRLAASL